MHLTLKLKILPDAEAQKKLWDASHRCTELWNACLEQRRDPKSWGRLSVFSQKKELPSLKKECPEFKKPSSQVLQNVVFDLDAAYRMFFTKRKEGDSDVGQPRFKSRRRFYTQEYSQPKTSFSLVDGSLKLAYGKNPKDKRQTLANTGHSFVNKRINRAVQNNNPLQKLIGILKYKAMRLGQSLQKVDERGTTSTCSQCDHKLKDTLKPEIREFSCPTCGFQFSRDHQACLNFLKRYEPAVWLRLPEIESGRSRRLALAPFSCKLQESWKNLPRLSST